MKAFAIAIDGPVASGKGTIAEALARELHGFHLNTGAMYRCLGLYCLEHKISVSDAPAVIQALSKITITVTEKETFLNGENVTEQIQQPAVAEAASAVAIIADVRKEMVKRQRAIGLEKIQQGQIVVVDGRDGATKIFPDAVLKIFLTASIEVRAKRRLLQSGNKMSYEEVREDTKQRDYQDTHRSADPLVLDPEAHGYLVIDDSHLSEHDTIAIVLEKLQSHL